jgi:hypothetical protein
MHARLPNPILQEPRKERLFDEERRLLSQKKRAKRVFEESFGKRLHEQAELLL